MRLDDNAGLFNALLSGNPVVPVFIYDSNILDNLKSKTDKRLSFIYDTLQNLHKQLLKVGSGLVIEYGNPVDVWKKLLKKYPTSAVYTNSDYEPYAIERDNLVKDLIDSKDIQFYSLKDQVIFEKDEITKDDGKPYSVYTPFKNKWKKILLEQSVKEFPSENFIGNFYKMGNTKFPDLKDIGFHYSNYSVPSTKVDPEIILSYEKTRDFPALVGTSGQSVHLRFGTVSIRQLVKMALELNETWLNELIWREFFMSVLYHFPFVEKRSFRSQYDDIEWRNNPDDFDRWSKGQTGFPLVDAGMRQLNKTGYMHNRVRMVVANFLTKDLLIDWRWGEGYFAEKLMDFDLAANNGNWQWSAGCGCDAAPYFRIFNPEIQLKKFGPDLIYVKKWIEEYDTPDYLKPMLNHSFARERALEVYGKALKNNNFLKLDVLL